MKWAGAAIILMVSLYAGLAGAWEEKRRVTSLEAFCRLVTVLQEEISILHTPQKEIFARFSDPYLEKTGFLTALRKGSGTSPLYGALAEEGMRRKLRLGEEPFGLLVSFARELGTQESARECARCEVLLGKLGRMLAEAREEAPKNAKIIRAASLTGGILAVLLLL